MIDPYADYYLKNVDDRRENCEANNVENFAGKIAIKTKVRTIFFNIATAWICQGQ